MVRPRYSRMTTWLCRHRDVVAYLLLGGCTTVVNIACYYLCAHAAHLSTGVSTVVAWIVSVAFAYVTNKRWAFDSRSWQVRTVLREAAAFTSCRLATGLFDIGFMLITVDRLHLNDFWMKVVANAVVVVANYVASKWLIFRKGNASDRQ